MVAPVKTLRAGHASARGEREAVGKEALLVKLKGESV